MAVTRTERLLNLVIALLAARAPLPRATIQRSVAGYDPEATVAAFERMFERDKDELRAMGIPVATITDPHGEVQGYSIDAREYGQADIDLSVDELAVLSVAARVWDEAVLAPAAVTALRKIESISAVQDSESAESAEGVEKVDVPATFASISASDAALLPLMRAIREHRVVRFAYRKPGTSAPQDRGVEPLSVQSIDGRWYVTGWDLDRGQERVFRLSRIDGPVTVTAQACQHRSTASTERVVAVDAHDEIEAVVRIPATAGAELRRLPGSSHIGDDRWRVRAPRSELLRVLWRADPSVTIEAPADLIADVAGGFERIAEAHS